MTKSLYRVGEGANLAAFPRGTKVGSIIPLTEAEAMYERDLGRVMIVSEDGTVSEPVQDPGQQLVIPGETRGHPVDAVSGEALTLTAQERAALPVFDQNASDEAVLDQGFPRSRKAR